MVRLSHRAAARRLLTSPASLPISEELTSLETGGLCLLRRAIYSVRYSVSRVQPAALYELVAIAKCVI